MGTSIIKIKDEKTNIEYYMEWSSIVDAPVTYGMELDEFKEYYRDEYGRSGYEDLEVRLVRVEKNGTSSQFKNSLDSYFNYNRAGENESQLDKEGILEHYCRNRPDGED